MLVDQALLERADQRLVARERRRGQPDQVAHAQLAGRSEHLPHQQVAVAEVMVRRDYHAVAQAGAPQRLDQARRALIAAGGELGAGSDRRCGLAALRDMPPDALVGQAVAAVYLRWDQPPGGVFEECYGHCYCLSDLDR